MSPPSTPQFRQASLIHQPDVAKAMESFTRGLAFVCSFQSLYCQNHALMRNEGTTQYPKSLSIRADIRRLQLVVELWMLLVTRSDGQGWKDNLRSQHLEPQP